MSQLDEVRAMLEDGWTCGTWFLRCYIPRYGARIFELRRLGYRVKRRQCQTHFHTGRQYEWRLVASQGGVTAADLDAPTAQLRRGIAAGTP